MPKGKDEKPRKRKVTKKQEAALKKGQSRMKKAAAEYNAGKYKSMAEALKHV